jgi:hypothetical protein
MTRGDQRSKPDPGTGDRSDEDETNRPEGQQPEQERQGPPPLPLDAVFETLKNERRRITLEYLHEHDQPVEMGELAEHVAIEENDIDPQSLTSTERKRAYVGLYQCHLPKMDELGVVEFERSRGRIALGPNADQLDPYLAAPEDDRRWASHYLTLAAVSTTLFVGLLAVGTLVELAAFSTVLTTVCGLTILSFGTLAATHHRRDGDPDGD